ncbi:MAG: YciI family protein [Phycisphaerales bacterium]
MQYLLLLYEDDAKFETMPEAEHKGLIAEYKALMREMQDAGVFLAAGRLRQVATATSVRVRSGNAMVTDGPFAETKEQLGGFLLIDVANLDEALAWAAKAPTARVGTVEVRPMWS